MPEKGPGPTHRAVARILHCSIRSLNWKVRKDRKDSGCHLRVQGSLHCEMYVMKIITAVVRPFKLDELRHAIAQLGVQGVTVTEVYEVQYGPRAKLEIAVDDAIVDPVLEAIANVSRTGRAGDGQIRVGNLEQAIRIRTGETGTAAT